VHRSAAVNIRHVRELTITAGGGLTAKLTAGTDVGVARGFRQHLEGSRRYFVFADFRVYPDCVRHLDHLYFSEKIRDLFAAFAFVGYRFAGLALCRSADGENFFSRALFTDLIRR